MRDYAHGACDASIVMTKLETLPGKASYAYHVLRTWTVVVKHSYPTVQGLKEESEKEYARGMATHVEVLYDLFEATDAWPTSFVERIGDRGRKLG